MESLLLYSRSLPFIVWVPVFRSVTVSDVILDPDKMAFRVRVRVVGDRGHRKLLR